MNRVSEFLVRFFMGQRLLQRIEKEATEGEVPVCDLYLKKGSEYEIRGCLANNAGEMELSIRRIPEIPIRTFTYKRGFGFIAPEDGVYQVWATIRRTGGEQLCGRATITINLCCPLRPRALDGMAMSSLEDLKRSADTQTCETREPVTGYRGEYEQMSAR